MTRVEIQSGADAAPSESLGGVFQVCDRGEARGWCVDGDATLLGAADPASEGRGR